MAKTAVLIPVFNAESYLLQTLESVAGQSDSDFRALIIDNGSTDGSVQIARKFAAKDRRFKFLKEKGCGIDKALNRGLKELRSEEFVSFLDHDDIYLPERNAKLLRFMNANRLDIAACNSYSIDHLGNRTGGNVSFANYGEHNLALAFFDHNLTPTMSMIMVRRGMIGEIGPFPVDSRWTLDYYLMVIALVSKKRVALLDERLIEKRFHGKNFGTDPGNVTLSRLRLGNLLYKSALADFLSPVKAREICNTRYVSDVQKLRRGNREGAIPGFLEELLEEKIIGHEFFDYFNIAALSRLDPGLALSYEQQMDPVHPLQFFAAGLVAYQQQQYQRAAMLFHESWQRSASRFMEALNGIAVATAFFSLEAARNALGKCLQLFPDFQDALRNYQLLSEARCRGLLLNPYITQRSLDLFLYDFGISDLFFGKHEQ